MNAGNTTCWTEIRAAAAGEAAARELFARRYSTLIRAYLTARWRRTPRIGELEDAVQELFLECFRAGGVLAKADVERPGGFRAFLYGVARHVALRFEQQRPRPAAPPNSIDFDALPADEPTLSRAFDRAWAQVILREAAALQEKQAAAAGAPARRRVELLRRRFVEGKPIRAIAQEWGVDAAELHREYARARSDFKEALREVLAARYGGSSSEIDRQCAELAALLQE